MSRLSLFIALLLLSTASVSVYAQQTTTYWFDQQGGKGDDGAHACAQDGNGNVYVGGHFSGIVNFGGVTLSSKGTSDGYLAKYSIAGQLLWAKQLGGKFDGRINALAVGSDGTVFAAGSISDTSYGSNMIAVKYDSKGNRKWSTETSERNRLPGSASAAGIAISHDGLSIYMAGTVRQDSLILSPASPKAMDGTPELTTICLDSNGAARWIRVTHSGIRSRLNAAYGCTTDDQDNVYMIGTFSDTLNSEGVRLLGSENKFLPIIVSYDSSGRQRWAEPFPSLGTAARSITCVSNRLYVTGDSALVCKFEPDGSIDGTLKNGGKTLGAGAITSDKLGRIYLMGRVFNAFRLDSLFVSNLGPPITFVLRIDTLLNPKWVSTLRSDGGLSDYSITADSFGHRFIAGTAPDSVSFGGLFSGTSGNRNDGFVAYFLERELTIKPLPQIDYCQLDTMVVPFEVRGGFYLGNTFYLQISDSLGRFFSPPTIAELYSNTSGAIHAFLPPGLHSGTKYRVRLQASTPGFVSVDNGTDLVVRSSPKASVLPGTTVALCESDTVTLAALGGVAYRWSTGESSQSIHVTRGGDYSVYVLGANGCGLPISIRVNETLVPPIPAVTRDNNLLRSNVVSGNQWWKDGHAIQDANSQEYLATQSGLYWVSVSNAAGCSSFSDSILVDLGDRSVAEAHRISPPSLRLMGSGELEISTEEAGPAQVSIFDILGRMIAAKSISLSEGSSRFELRSLFEGSWVSGTGVQGHYIIRVAQGQQIYSKLVETALP